MEEWGRWPGRLCVLYVCSRPAPLYLSIKGCISLPPCIYAPNLLLPQLEFTYYSSEAQYGSGAPSGGHALELGVQLNDGL